MAILVVGIHAHATYNSPTCPDWLNLIMRFAVPFFFMASGFLLEQKIINDNKNIKSTYNHFLKKCIQRYLIWTLIYLPLTIYAFYSNKHSWYIDVFIFVRNLLLVGENHLSWPLWYLLAVIVAVFIIKILRTKGISLYIIWIIGLIFFAIGWLYQQIDSSSLQGIPHLLYKTYSYAFSSTRNGVFQGLAYVSTGMFIAHIKTPRFKSFSITAILLIVSVILYYCNFRLFSTIFGGAALFILSINIELKDASTYSLLRKYSTFIYFIHMYFLAISFIIGREYFNFYTVWLYTAICSTVTAIIFVYLSQKPIGKWIKHLL